MCVFEDIYFVLFMLTLAIDPRQLILVPPPERPPKPELLSSDDEGAPVYVPPTLRSLPPHFPPLPPKHTYLRTPVSHFEKARARSKTIDLDPSAQKAGAPFSRKEAGKCSACSRFT